MPDPVVTQDPVATPPPVSSPSAPAAAPTALAEPSFTYKEDRSAWVDPNRFRAAERATNFAAQRAAKLEADIVERDRKIAALAGVSPEDPAKADADRVLDALYAMAPHLRPDHIEGVRDTADRLRQQEEQRWDQHRDKTFDDVSSRVAQAIGKEQLTEAGTRKVAAAFRAWVPDQRSDPDGYARFAARYERGDVKLLDEFVQEFVDDFITPAQRAGMVRPRVAVPSGGFSRPVAMNQNKQPDFSKMSVAEMLAAGEELADAHYQK